MNSSKLNYSKNESKSGCIFSTPKFSYSSGTKEFMKVLMKESRLTNVQKDSFEGILRKGDPLPSNPSELMMRKYQLYRRRLNAASDLGIPVGNRFSRSSKPSFYQGSGKRSYNTIVSSGAFQDSSYQSYKYVPVNKEREKDRFIHKMAFGTEPPAEGEGENAASNSKALCTTGKQLLCKEPPAAVRKYEDDLKQERLEEILEEIQDRGDFLLTMKKLHQDRQHRHVILAQIKDKTREIRSLYPDEANQIIEALDLKEIDPEYPFF